MNGAEDPDLMTPAEVAVLFRVDPKTVTRWGHLRLYRAEVEALLRGETP